MNFSFLLVLCLFNLIHGRYLLVDVDDQQVRELTPPPPRIQETKPPPKPACIQPGGKCLSKTKFSISIEFSARSIKGPSECCKGYTCVSGMCLNPRINLDWETSKGLGKMTGIAKKPPGKPCQGRPTDGPCAMEVSGYKFDPDSNSCIKFVGGGCGYSNNGFGTKDDCEAKCSTSSIKNQEEAAPASRCQNYGEVCMSDSECCSQNCVDGNCGAI